MGVIQQIEADVVHKVEQSKARVAAFVSSLARNDQFEGIMEDIYVSFLDWGRVNLEMAFPPAKVVDGVLVFGEKKIAEALARAANKAAGGDGNVPAAVAPAQPVTDFGALVARLEAAAAKAEAAAEKAISASSGS